MSSLATPPSPANPAPPWPEPSRGVIATACRDLVYLTAVLSMSLVAGVVWLTGLSLTASLIVLVIGGLVWLGTVRVLRWITEADRTLAGWYLRREVSGAYRPVPSGGLGARIRTVSADPRTWRDLLWLVGNSTAGFVASGAAIVISGTVLSYILTPLWWWSITDPHQQYGTLNLGAYTVTSLPLALLTSAIGMVLAPLALSLNHVVARSHASIAERALGR